MRSIIYQDLEESNFYCNFGEFQFYFSSEFNRNRFENKCYSYIIEEINKLKNRYNFKTLKIIQELKNALAITFYKKIEKRGFRVYKKGERFLENE